MNRILKLVLILLSGCLIFMSCENPTDPQTQITERIFLPTQDNVKYLDRSTLINNQLEMTYSSKLSYSYWQTFKAKTISRFATNFLSVLIS